MKLYIAPGRFYLTSSHPAYGRGTQPKEVRERLVNELEKIPDLTGILQGYGAIMGAERAQ